MKFIKTRLHIAKMYFRTFKTFPDIYTITFLVFLRSFDQLLIQKLYTKALSNLSKTLS